MYLKALLNVLLINLIFSARGKGAWESLLVQTPIIVKQCSKKCEHQEKNQKAGIISMGNEVVLGWRFLRPRKAFLD